MLLVSTAGTALAQSASSSQQINDASAAKPQASTKKDSSDAVQLEEVLVTAERRSQTLLQAPVAVSVLTTQALESAGVVGIQDLNAIAPNLEIRQVGADNGMNVTIRGVSDTSFNDNATPSVATYVDGFYIGRTEGLEGSLFDLDRIEVLRGPQGTLYGRNSPGGNLNIETASPTQDFGAAADLSYGNYNEFQEHAMINVPVTDTLALRGAISTDFNDGYVKTMGSTFNNYYKADDYAGRVSLLWHPTDWFKWRLSIDDSEQHGSPNIDILTAVNGKPANGGSPYEQQVSNSQEPLLDASNRMIRSRMEFTLREGVTLSYIGGYENVQDQIGDMQVESPIYRNTPSKSTSQEVDLNIDIGRVHNIVGGDYYFQHFYSGGDLDFEDNAAAGILFLAHGDAFTRSSGAFDQLTFDLTDRLKVTGGLRYSHEGDEELNNQFSYCSDIEFPPQTYPLSSLLLQQFTLPGCATVPGLSGGRTAYGVSASNVSWKAGLQYDVSDHTSSYLNVSTGFKAGGVNLGPGLSDLTFKPEEVINYEAGLKTRFLDNRAGLNVAVFLMNYTDIQISQLIGEAGADETTNAAGARMYGVESEGEWRITNNDRLNGFLNYLHATYTSYQNADDQWSGVVYPSLDGHYLPYSPEFSGRVEYTHQIPLTNGGTIIANGAVFWQTVSYLREFNLPIDTIPSYSKTDLGLKYIFPDHRFDLGAYVHNLEDKAVRNGSYAFIPGQYLSSYNPPRTFGMKLSYKY